MRFSLFIALLLFLCINSQQAESQPVAADLTADSIAYSFSAPDTLKITAYYSFYNSFDRDSTLSSDITIFLDGISVFWSELNIDASEAVCRDDSINCLHEMCDAKVSPGKVLVRKCSWLRLDPIDTIPPMLMVCSCYGAFSDWEEVHYSGEKEISFRLDSMDEILETNEGNNETSLSINPIPALGRLRLVLLAVLLVSAGAFILRHIGLIGKRPHLRI